MRIQKHFHGLSKAVRYKQYGVYRWLTEQANTLTTKAIQHLLKGIDLDGLLVRVGEYQQKTGKDASKLVDFINNLKQMQQDGNGE